MEIILNATSAQPIYEQIVVSIKEAIMRGELKEGDPLPSMRRLAKDLHVSVITTQRAYEELEKAGFLVIVPAKGAFVAALSQEDVLKEHRQRIDLLFAQACALACSCGIEKRELLAMLETSFEERTHGKCS